MAPPLEVEYSNSFFLRFHHSYADFSTQIHTLNESNEFKWVQHNLYLHNFFEHLLIAPLSWKTNKCRPEDLRGGALSIRLFPVPCSLFKSQI